MTIGSAPLAWTVDLVRRTLSSAGKGCTTEDMRL